MLGAGALANGLGGASPNPVEDTAAALSENSSEISNGSAQLSVDDLASVMRALTQRLYSLRDSTWVLQTLQS